MIDLSDPPTWLRVGIALWRVALAVIVAAVVTGEWRMQRRWNETMKQERHNDAMPCAKCKAVTDDDELAPCVECHAIVCPNCCNDKDVCVDCAYRRIGGGRHGAV